MEQVYGAHVDVSATAETTLVAYFGEGGGRAGSFCTHNT